MAGWLRVATPCGRGARYLAAPPDPRTDSQGDRGAPGSVPVAYGSARPARARGDRALRGGRGGISSLRAGAGGSGLGGGAW